MKKALKSISTQRSVINERTEFAAYSLQKKKLNEMSFLPNITVKKGYSLWQPSLHIDDEVIIVRSVALNCFFSVFVKNENA